MLSSLRKADVHTISTIKNDLEYINEISRTRDSYDGGKGGGGGDQGWSDHPMGITLVARAEHVESITAVTFGPPAYMHEDTLLSFVLTYRALSISATGMLLLMSSGYRK